jgi:glycosyltransferase involved in cell wall biosynthesis/ubiquinone/menaquinone biosynthesis C-methylase UbiE
MSKKIKVAILDTVGLSYTGDTVRKQGLGGSESAVIFMAEELVKQGFEVSIFNDCPTPGVYYGVNYYERKDVKAQNQKFDILISQRSFIPFIPEDFKFRIWEEERVNLEWYLTLVKNSTYRVVWLHDLWCPGEHWLEYLVANKYIDEMFTLSDFHYNWYINKNNQNFELLKTKFFQTRNGITSYGDEVDIESKDKNLFVFNASAIKGMGPLLDTMWPKVKAEIPEAKLLIIGGVYRWTEEGQNLTAATSYWDNFYIEYRKKYDNKLGVKFLGIIPQKEVAELYKKASFFLYTNILQETYGISTTEAINYNVPLIGMRHGALEEIAAEKTSYLTDYYFNKDDGQADKVLAQVKLAYYNDDLRKQKMLACNDFKGWLGWDLVGLQWKIHFHRLFGLDISNEDKQKQQEVFLKHMHLYNKRIINNEDLLLFSGKEKPLSVKSQPTWMDSVGINLLATEKIREDKNSDLVKDLKEALEFRPEVPVYDNYNNVRVKWMLDEMKKLDTSKTVLDIGSWIGGVSNEVYKLGFKDITCFEIGREVIKVGKSKYPHLKWIQGDIESYEFKDKYDIVLMMEILEHLVDPEAAIKKALSLLNDGGTLILTVPDEEHVFEGQSREHISKLTKNDFLKFTDNVELLKSDSFQYAWYVAVIKK